MKLGSLVGGSATVIGPEATVADAAEIFVEDGVGSLGVVDGPNLVGIITSSTIVYHFAGFLGLRDAFERKYPGKIQRVRSALGRKELPIIIGWSFFPVVPTDLIIYVASTLKIPLWRCLLGVLIGEGALNAFYIFSVNATF